MSEHPRTDEPVHPSLHARSGSIVAHAKSPVRKAAPLNRFCASVAQVTSFLSGFPPTSQSVVVSFENSGKRHDLTDFVHGPTMGNLNLTVG